MTPTWGEVPSDEILFGDFICPSLQMIYRYDRGYMTATGMNQVRFSFYDWYYVPGLVYWRDDKIEVFQVDDLFDVVVLDEDEVSDVSSNELF